MAEQPYIPWPSVPGTRGSSNLRGPWLVFVSSSCHRDCCRIKRLVILRLQRRFLRPHGRLRLHSQLKGPHLARFLQTKGKEVGQESPTKSWGSSWAHPVHQPADDGGLCGGMTVSMCTTNHLLNCYPSQDKFKSEIQHNSNSITKYKQIWIHNGTACYQLTSTWSSSNLMSMH